MRRKILLGVIFVMLVIHTKYNFSYFVLLNKNQTLCARGGICTATASRRPTYVQGCSAHDALLLSSVAAVAPIYFTKDAHFGVKTTLIVDEIIMG